MEKIINMRELGGIVNQQGMQIKGNKLFRAGNPSVANEADRERLQQLAFDEVVDFRSAFEKRTFEQVFAKEFNWVAQPVFTGNLEELLNQTLSKETAEQAMCDIYRRFPVDFQAQFRYLLMQAEQGKTLLYHCTAGKDRTGFATLLLLSALEVDFDTILQDYLSSNAAVARLKIQLSDFGGEGIDEEALRALLQVTPVYLDNALQVINKEFGGVMKYLQFTLDVDIKAIRQHYLEC